MVAYVTVVTTNYPTNCPTLLHCTVKGTYFSAPVAVHIIPLYPACRTVMKQPVLQRN